MSSRPATPDSPSSLRKANATIDDLTAALANFSHGASLEPEGVTTCCCGKHDCENSLCWAAYKAKLEDRLVLSAEVGQALLQRHEAYVRRHESGYSLDNLPMSLGDLSEQTKGDVDVRVADLLRENAMLEKRFSQALINNEATDLAYQKVLTELKEAKEKIAQLSAHNARLTGIDKRLTRALEEKDDIQQECNSATQRAKIAETRVTSLKERCAKLQAQVGRVREDLEIQRSYKQELSNEILTEARSRLQHLQHLDVGSLTKGDDDEVTKVLESLVADNEDLKHDNAELQDLLTEAREDLRVLREEVDEHRAETPFRRHRASDSIGSSVFQDSYSPLSSAFNVGTAPVLSVMNSVFARQNATPSSSRRAQSTERERRPPFEPLTPETDRRPLSPTDAVLAGRLQRPSLRPRSNYPPSHLSLELEDEGIDEEQPDPTVGPRPPKSLLLLTRSRAVQTDETPSSSSLGPPRTPGEHLSSHDGQSDSSSFAENSSTVVGILVERIGLLLHRLMQADALTLTTRLKRQHLVGADVSHLSRTTVSGILNEANALRLQFRAFLEDEKITSTCTRRDLRALFKLFKDMFTEMGQLRVTLNDVILDPTVAGRVSDLALNPSKSASNASSDPAAAVTQSGSSWMAPISKLLGLPGGSGVDEAAARALAPPARPSARTMTRPATRIVPKRGPALAASATTVNVEFTGAGVGRAVTSTVSDGMDHSMLTAPTAVARQNSSGSGTEVTKSVMDIFAGAPRPVDPVDPWVVIPKPQRAGTLPSPLLGSTTIGRATSRSASVANFRSRLLPKAGSDSSKRLPRAVDAVIDPSQAEANGEEAAEARDVVYDTLLQRTLRPRGLSDSSIHTTFMSHAAEAQEQSAEPSDQGNSVRPDTQSVLQTLSKKMQSFKIASSVFSTPPRPYSVGGTRSENQDDEATVVSQTKSTTSKDGSGDDPTGTATIRKSGSERTAPSSSHLFQNLNLASWASPATKLADSDSLGDTTEAGRPPPFYVGTMREESGVSRGFRRGREM
ncbi:hypothetical protein BDY19DRAFT_944884 [Irpex rosettiformis]|uniref:Uncharacterized protein n=1 Tax=Irpex rosettiformis TaxID=378272 RepID=A0ACB8U4G8_9APHY|nr:hypothetical protein BDY19DRAFT_944884 [Irpex rosettiformis]